MPQTPRTAPSASRGLNLAQLSDSQIIAVLASGEHSAAIQAIFGDAEYRELSKIARQLTRSKTRLNKGRVYLLPGIMGSILGKKSRSQAIWLNPDAIAAGELLSLALPAKPALQPLGVMLPGYLKLKLHLQLAGFDVVFHAFDWRKSVLDSGKLLMQRIAHDSAKKVSIVAHSMGGLVARAALAQDTKKRIARIVQLGSPNFGSFALVQALRGTYPTVRKVAALDPSHSTDQLVRHVFRTLPGLYEMLPAPEHTKDLDLLQLDSWPDDLLGPDATLLGSATLVRKQLAAARDGCFHIIGVEQETATRVRKGRKGLEYGITHDGDGTVPRALAEWPGAAAWYVRERHGNLTKNEAVCKAVIDLLKSGKSRRLAKEIPRASREVLRWVSDADLRRDGIGGHKGKVRWQQLSPEERRRILEPVISAEFHELAVN